MIIQIYKTTDSKIKMTILDEAVCFIDAPNTSTIIYSVPQLVRYNLVKKYPELIASKSIYHINPLNLKTLMRDLRDKGPSVKQLMELIKTGTKIS